MRQIGTGLYFQGPDLWTTNPAEAFDFRMIDRALGFVRRWHLQEKVEIAFAFKDRHVKRVPLEKIELHYSEG